MNISRWVDDRLSALDVAGWRPNPARALALLRERERARRRRRAGFLWGSLAAAAAGMALLVLSAPQACATPNGCAEHVWQTVFPKRVVPAEERIVPPASKEPRVAPGSQPQIKEPAVIQQPPPPVKIGQVRKPDLLPARAAAPASITNFKEQGSPTAAVTLEIYTDYECPSCAMLYRDFVPALMAEYVRTGKVKLQHRDFPLPQHPHSKMAARYANAAGRLGYYDTAVEQIFKTQDKWSGTGDIDAQLVPVLPPGVMQKVRDMVKSDHSLDASVEADLAMVQTDRINQTPTIVVVSKGKRQPVAGMPRWDLFQSYLDKLLAP
jgi:protein-disulfide isomerase